MIAQIHFLFSAHLGGYFFNPLKPEGLSFTDAQTGLEIEIRGEGSHDDPWDGFKGLKVRAKASFCATEDQIGFVETLINGRIVMPDKTPALLPYILKHRGEVVTAHGDIAEGYSPTSDFLPKELQELLISTGKELNKHADRFVKLLRWLSNADGQWAVLRDASHVVAGRCRRVEQRQERAQSDGCCGMYILAVRIGCD